MEKKIPKRILNLIINSLSAGVVPRVGAPYIAIGRRDETESLISDLENVAEGGSALRFLVGRYGSGKSFLLQLIKSYATENGFVTADADLSPERRLYGSNGNGVATYRELVNNMSVKTSAEGGALPIIISRWLSAKQSELIASGILPDSEELFAAMRREVFSVTRELEDKVGGFDFAAVLYKYYLATVSGDDALKSACNRWLRGEYLTKSEAKKTLGTQGIITDDNWYDYLKLIAVFVKQIGYRGLMIYIDECVNLYKITNRVSRENNYEKILSIFNDTLQGKAPYLGVVFAGTPQFLEDTRRGLFSYEALRSRLSDSTFVTSEYKNLSGPVIRLVRLTDSELYALVKRIKSLYSECFGYTVPITEDEDKAFLTACLTRAGADVMITPREIIRSYISLLHVLRQNPEADFSSVVGKLSGELKSDAEKESKTDDELTDFEL